jgi:hypothetical protein
MCLFGSKRIIGRSVYQLSSIEKCIATMGQIHPHPPAMLILAAFSRYDEALDWARDRIAGSWGHIELESPRFEFRETDYYESSMGAGLKKTFFACGERIDPARLADLKLATNAWEEEYVRLGLHAESRPLNLDPGYLTLAKLVLASTKDHSHRIYLSQGIYAEVTLYYQDRRWQHRPWTFPDYRREDYQQFFTACRQRLKP